MLLALAHCSTTTASDGGLEDANAGDVLAFDARDGVVQDVPESPSDASTPLRRCPTSGRGTLLGDPCFVVTPIETGLSSQGTNADVDQYALRPVRAARGQLVLYFNGSGGSPRGGIASPSSSFYSVARDSGLHVLALSYRSDDSIGGLCARATDRDTCFSQSRRSIIEGRYLPGAASELASISPSEGIYPRALAALTTLAQRDPEGGWEMFFDPAMRADPARALRWDRVIAAGHSQGGGHAAMLGRLHALHRVLMLASPCDNTAGTPARWLTEVTDYQTPPAERFRALGARMDALCSTFVAAWQSLGLAPSARDPDAVVCAGSTPHGAPINCVENADRWARMLAP
jgi:hypothetical protein